MGKSTTVKAICRMIPSTGGLRFDGRDLSRLPSHRAAQAGLGLVPEGRRCFAPLTVEENLIAAARPGEWTFETVAALFPGWASGGRSVRPRSRAGSSRCWPLAAR